MEDHTNDNVIKKIKLQEQEQNAKLKEKRENETIIANLNRAIRDATIQTEKSKQEQEKLVKLTDSLRKRYMLDKIRSAALSDQLSALEKELKHLQDKYNEKISKIWERRSSFCKEIHSTSDICDAWTLLMKPTCPELLSRNIQKNVQNPTSSTLENERRLQVAIERRVKALAERDRLAAETNCGEDFKRIENALLYTLDKITELNRN